MGRKKKADETGKPTPEDKAALKILVGAYKNVQHMRIGINNRIGLKRDGTIQNIEERTFRIEDAEFFATIAKEAERQERQIEKKLGKMLQRFPIYREWLSTVKGVGAISAGWIIAEFDIQKAGTVSKMWQFAGLNPGQKRGKKEIVVDKYKPDDGDIIATIERKNGNGGEKKYLVETYELVRGDKLTPGFVSPFNKNLRTALVGVLAVSFIQQKSPYAIEHYYPYKERLEREDNLISGEKKAWSAVSKGRRDRAARRFMIKKFLQDLYVKWRTIEGLPVREPYAEGYLGKRHAA